MADIERSNSVWGEPVENIFRRDSPVYSSNNHVGRETVNNLAYHRRFLALSAVMGDKRKAKSTS